MFLFQSSSRKSALLSAAKKAKLKNNPSRVRFAESVDINGSPLFNVRIFVFWIWILYFIIYLSVITISTNPVNLSTYLSISLYFSIYLCVFVFNLLLYFYKLNYRKNGMTRDLIGVAYLNLPTFNQAFDIVILVLKFWIMRLDCSCRLY